LGLHELAIVGLAKERETITGDKLVDRVYLPGQKNGIPLRGESSALFFLARARDEAHRFANVHREKLGKKRRLSSELDTLKGVGPELKKRLLLALGTVDAVKSADRERLLAIPGITARHADAVARWVAASTSEDGVRATTSSSSASG
jgi:excinuclease ABC subunit C